MNHQPSTRILNLNHKVDDKNFQHEIILMIRNRFGINIKPQQTQQLKKIIIEACQQFLCTPETYLQLLKDASENSPLIEHLVRSITVGETYFFRDKTQIHLLQEHILPKLIAQKRAENHLTLRIWSAGSASGEEIYTIAMLLYELLPDLNKWKLQLLGTDINTTLLKKALHGHYAEWSMRSINPYYKKQYFVYENNYYTISEKLRNLVNFSYLNLNRDCYPSLFNGTHSQDLIICRNVLIYFDEDHSLRLLNKLGLCLADRGYLLLGASDPLNIKNIDSTLQHQQGTLFKKRDLHATKPQQPLKKTNIHYGEQKIINKKHFSLNEKKVVLPDEQTVIKTLINAGEWEKASLALTEYEKHENNSIFALNKKAIVLANLGNLDEAIKICHTCLNKEPTNPEIHFTLAMILVEKNQLQEAADRLKKVIFLDPKFVEGHFQLGLLLIRAKKHHAGLRHIRNALVIAKKQEKTDIVRGFPGLNYGRLAEILERELLLHSSPEGKSL